MTANRRSTAALFLAAVLSLAAAPGQPTPGPDCVECPHFEAPADPPASLVIPTGGLEGTRLVVEGTIYRPDGRTPAAGVLLYAYHTNPEGIYPKAADATGMARWHGTLRGWLRTGPDGRYRVETVRPGPYPGGSIPAHIHMHVMPEGGRERWIDDIVFDDDPYVDAAYRSRARNIGGPGIVRPTRDPAGVLRVTRDIILPE